MASHATWNGCQTSFELRLTKVLNFQNSPCKLRFNYTKIAAKLKGFIPSGKTSQLVPELHRHLELKREQLRLEEIYSSKMIVRLLSLYFGKVSLKIKRAIFKSSSTFVF